MMRGSVRLIPPGEDVASPTVREVVLLPERAVYWPARRTLMVADLHLGKSGTFRSVGAPIPDGVMDSDLSRLAAALRATEAQRLVILGDLLHAAPGVTRELIEHVAEWRNADGRGSLEILVVPGNHDRRLDLVSAPWGLRIPGPSFIDGPFSFRHDPGDAAAAGEGYTWAGHLHPMISLRGGGDRLRLPCFWLGAAAGVLPAFSEFTRGVTIRPGKADRVFAVADQRVIEV